MNQNILTHCIRKHLKPFVTITVSFAAIIIFCLANQNLIMLEYIFWGFALLAVFTSTTELVLNFLYSKIDYENGQSKINTLDYTPTVAAIIPTRNEPVDVIKMTVESVLQLDYPKNKLQLVLIDNSEETNVHYHALCEYANMLQEECDIEFTFLHRNGTDGYKARNIDIALKNSDSEVVLFLDVDSTLSSNSLKKSIAELYRGEDAAFVQMETIPTNLTNSSWVTQVQGVSSFIQRRIQGGCMKAFYSMFYGHNAVWKRVVLEKVGSWVETFNGETILTEDMSMSLRASKLGFKGSSSSALSGEWVPTSLKEVERMWYRWTYGTFQVFFKHLRNPFSLKSISFREAAGWYYHVFSYVNSGLFPVYVILSIITDSIALYGLLIFCIFSNILMVFINGTKLEFKGISKLSTRMMLCYQSVFLLGAYISWVKFKAAIGFIFNKCKGWVPTAKTNSSKTASILAHHIDILAYIALFILIICLTYDVPSGFGLKYLVIFVYPFHLLVSLFVLRDTSSKNKAEYDTNLASVNWYKSSYIS